MSSRLRNLSKKVADKIPSTSGLKKWKRRVEASTVAYYGNKPRGDYVIRIQAGGTRRYVSLLTTDLQQAARSAQQLFWDVKSIGWEAAVAKLKPAPPEKGPRDLTLAEYLDHVAGLHIFNPFTFHEYRAKMRTLVSQCLGIEGRGSEKWSRTGGRTPWQKRVEGIKISQLTPELIRRFMAKYVDLRTDLKNPRSQIRATHAVNGLVRNTRAVFSRKKVVPLVTLPLPPVLPFDGVRLFREDLADYRFVKEIDAQELLGLAEQELFPTRRKLYVILLLGLVAGLRRNEVDKLRWMDVRETPVGPIVEVARTEFQKGKSKASLRKIRIPTDCYEILQEFRDSARDVDFVVPSTIKPQINTKYRHYRCANDFKALCAWIKGKGLAHDGKSIHMLRKLFGDVICNTQGIYAACAALGHQKVSTTEIHYAAPPDVAPAPFHFRPRIEPGSAPNPKSSDAA